MSDVAILNPRLLAVLAGAGHTDLVVVADAGLAVPRGVEVVDLSLVPGVPSLLQVLDAVLAVLKVESAVLALETKDQPLHRRLASRLQHLDVLEIPHEEFKRRVAEARAIVRSGECTPYANVGLVAGVTF